MIGYDMQYPQQLFYVTHAHIKRQAWPWSKGKLDWGSVKEPLPDNWAVSHMANGPHYGTYFVSGDRCHAAMIDIDDHDGKQGWDNVTRIADDILTGLDEAGLTGHPFRSRGGKGINIWIIWDEPQQAAGVRAAIRSVLAQADYKEAAGFIEVFPKQDKVVEDELGNAACLPRTPLDPWSFEDSDHVAWTCSEPVAEVDVEDVAFRELEMKPSPEQIDELLEHIPNDGEGLEYDTWASVIAAVKASGGTYEQAQQWSAQSSKHNQQELKKKWPSFKRSKGSISDFNTLVKLANIHGGYRGTPALLEAFPTVEVTDENGKVLDGVVEVTYPRIGGRGRYATRFSSDLMYVDKCMRVDPMFPYHITFDMFLADALLHDKSSTSFVRVEDHHYTALCLWFEQHNFEPLPTIRAKNALKLIAKENIDNIATRWAESLEWDGVDRFDHAIRAMGVEYTEYARAVVEYQWTAHAARALDPGHQADSIIVFVSEEQGMGKSTLIKSLAPEFHGLTTWRDITIEQLLKESDSARAMSGTLVANMDEMRNFSKREAAEAKAALSRTHESYVPKYLETRTSFGRQCLIYATNNKPQFLDDETGNRRYHALSVGKIDIDWFKANRDQLWAQGIAQFRASGVAWQRAAELNKSEVAKYEVDDDWEGAIAEWLDMEQHFAQYVTGAQVLVGALKFKIADVGRPEQTRVGKVMKKLGWQHKQEPVGPENRRIWVYKPPRKLALEEKGSDTYDW